MTERVAEIYIFAVESKACEDGGAVGPYFFYGESFGRFYGRAFGAFGFFMLCLCGERELCFGWFSYWLIVEVYPLRAYFYYGVAEFAVTHIEGAGHGAGHVAAAVGAAGDVLAERVVVAVDVGYHRIFFKYGEVVGAVVEVVEERVVVE